MERKVIVTNRETPYKGFFQIDRFRLRHSTPDGGMSPEITREVFERGHAAALLAYDRKTDQVLVIGEFRIGRLAAGCEGADCWSTGPVAGMIENDEDPRDCVIREAREEAGVDIPTEALIGPLTVYSSPGGSSEKISLFIANVSLEDIDPNSNGNDGEGEFTEPMITDRKSLTDDLFHGDRNGHLAVLLLWLDRMIARGEI